MRALSSLSEHTYRRILLFISPPGTISDAMTAAIEREFSWVSVMHVSEPHMACVKFDCDVQLIIVDHSLMDNFQAYCDRLSEIHPRANTAVMTDTQFDRVEQLIQFIEARAVRGILPTDVNLDIWLSIIRLMLKGGAYIPHKLLQPPQLIERGQRDGARDQRLRPLGSHAQWGAMMNNLTSREFEILAMVARGNQNKNIATDLGLSQNTVKIHLHNIIRKLGVHNRTEAAAKYFEFNKHRYGTASQSNDQEVDHDASERNDDKHENRSAPSSD